MKTLYKVAGKKLVTACAAENEKLEDISHIFNQVEIQLIKISDCLNNPSPRNNAKVHAYVEDGLKYVRLQKRKFKQCEDTITVTPLEDPR